MYSSPIHISTTTTLRAAAFKNGYISTNVDTETYLFLDDVIHQPNNPAGYPTQWVETSGGSSTTPGDYEMDSEVVADPAYAATIINDLKSIPTLSLVMNPDDWFGAGTIKGIYNNPQATDPQSATVKQWERAVSVELIYPDGSQGFQIDAGVQVHGGGSRIPTNTAKHTLTLGFKSEYDGDLDYPLFGPDGADSFDTIVLRGTYNNSWTHWDAGQRLRGQYIQDAWSNDVQAAMGDPARRGNYVHLYINGMYWGLYNPSESPRANYASLYWGGPESDYDVMKDSELFDGNRTAWNAMFNLANTGNINGGATDPNALASDANYQLMKQYLDMTSFCDYMIGKLYAGDGDWDGHNWLAIRRSRVDGVVSDTAGGFRFFNWDGERILESIGANMSGVNNDQCPTRLFQKLRVNAEFCLLWADRVHKFLFNDGPLTPENAKAIYAAEATLVDRAAVAESARWGDWRRDVLPNGAATLYTRNGAWVTERDWLMNTYFPARTAAVLSQFRTLGLYPSVAAPEFTQFGGHATWVTITNPGGAGTIYYTLDGSDPRLPGGNISPTAQTYLSQIHLLQSAHVKARVLSGATWSALLDAPFYVNAPAAAGNLAITEVNYHPLAPTAAELAVNPDFTDDDFQFVEIENAGSQSIDLTDVTLTFGFRQVFDFATSAVTALAAGSRVVVVANQAAFQARYFPGGIPAGLVAGQFAYEDPAAGPTTGKRMTLGHGSERICLRDCLGQAIEDFTYSDGGQWPGRADGDGSTLEVIDPAGDYTDPDNWRSSIDYNGSPGTAGTAAPRGIVINEVLTHTDPPLDDSIEIYNTNPVGTSIDLSGWCLSDSSGNLKKLRIADGTTLGGGQYLVFSGFSFYFGLDGAHGDDVWLVQADPVSGRILEFVDHVSFDAAVNGESFGRWPNGTGDLVPMTARTLYANPAHPEWNDNAYGGNSPRVGPAVPGAGRAVISEVMYHPPTPASGLGADELESVRICNPTATAMSLTNWRLRGDVDFDFAANTPLPALGSLILVSFDPNPASPKYNADQRARFLTRYPGTDPSLLVGPFSGHLDNSGGTIRLLRPDSPPTEEPEYFPGLLEDEVHFDDVAPWPVAVDGSGYSLQRQLGAIGWGNDPGSWTAAAPTLGFFENPPVAADDAYTIGANTALTLTVPGLLVNDTDPDANPLTVVWVEGPTNGALALKADGALTYTPKNGFLGSDSFTYEASDGQLRSNRATVFVEVAVPYLTATINQAPTQADPTSGATIDFTVVFNAPVSDFATGDVTLGGTAGATTAVVTGGETTYNVAVSGMARTGTVIAAIAAGVAHDAQNHPNMAATSADNTVTFDATPPTAVSINRVGSSLTSASTVRFTVTFSESVTGVGATDFALVLSGTTGTISSIAGGGTTYTVTVNGVSGNGTLGLDLVDDDSIADLTGNKLGGTGAGNGNLTGQTFTIDTLLPAVVSIDRIGPSPTSAASVQFALALSESVMGVDTTDFALALAGTTGTIVSVNGSGSSYTVTVNGVSGDGTLGLNLVDNDTIMDPAGNRLGGTGLGNGNFTGQTYAVDTSLPAVVSINRIGFSPTSAASVQYAVTFNEDVTGVDPADFAPALAGTTGTITAVAGSGAAYTVTLNGVSGNGTLGLDLVDDDTIADSAGTRLGGTGPGNGNFTGQVYTIDTTAPVVVSVNRIGPSPTNAASVQYAVTFSEDVTGVDPTDFARALAGATGTIASVAGGGATYTVTLSGVSGNGTLRLDLVDDDSIADPAGNGLGGTGPGNGNCTGQTFTIDTAVPTVLSITRCGVNPSSGGSVQFAVAVSEIVTGVDVADFALALVGTTGTIASVAGGGAAYTVTVNGVSGSGSVGLNLVDDDSITDATGNRLGGAGLGNGSFTGQAYVVNPRLIYWIKPAEPEDPSTSNYRVTGDGNVVITRSPGPGQVATVPFELYAGVEGPGGRYNGGYLSVVNTQSSCPLAGTFTQDGTAGVSWLDRPSGCGGAGGLVPAGPGLLRRGRLRCGLRRVAGHRRQSRHRRQWARPILHVHQAQRRIRGRRRAQVGGR